MTSTYASEPTPTGLEVGVQGLVRRFVDQRGRAVEVLAGLDLAVPASQFVALLGPSGSGKSTFLRLVAGLDVPDAGSIAIDGRRLGRYQHAFALAFVFQEAHLLPWRTLEANVRLPLELVGAGRTESRDRAAQMLEKVGLADAAHRYPAQLSGGMQMRGSLARALVTEPKLLLLDEPFAALDEITRQRLDALLYDLWRERRFTTMFVTHSLREAAFLAERCIMFSRRPARIVSERTSDLPLERERDAELRMSPRYQQLAEMLYQDLLVAEGQA